LCANANTAKNEIPEKNLVFFYLYVDLEEVGGFTWCTRLHPYCTRRCSGVGAPSNCPNYTGNANGITIRAMPME
jgi:hypothetical protein